MSEEYEIRPVRKNVQGGEYVSIPKNSPFFGEKYVKIMRLKE